MYTKPRIHQQFLPHAIKEVINQWFCLHAHLGQVTYDFQVTLVMLVTVGANGKEQILRDSRQLWACNI